MFIITKGEVEVVYEGKTLSGEKVKRKVLKTLSKGDVFGEISFFTNHVRTASIYSKGFSKVFKIS